MLLVACMLAAMIATIGSTGYEYLEGCGEAYETLTGAKPAETGAAVNESRQKGVWSAQAKKGGMMILLFVGIIATLGILLFFFWKKNKDLEKKYGNGRV